VTKRAVDVWCSPDADDLFMMRAITEGLIDTGDWDLRVRTEPTDALNRRASRGEADVCAMSIAHYPAIHATWQLLPHGGSAGEGYGPVLVAKSPIALDDLRGRRVAVPGLTTTAWAVLRSLVEVDPVVTPISPYALIFDAIRNGDVDAGLVIHEGRLTWADEGMVLLGDIGVLWAEATGGLPLPLGGNAIRRDLGATAIAELSEILRASIVHGLDHRDDAIDWLLARGGPLDSRARVDQYLAMYANERTRDWGEDGRRAIVELLRRGSEAGLFPAVEVDFAP
jgi:1,4-dihydroxy-6-naphthoate synthase